MYRTVQGTIPAGQSVSNWVTVPGRLVGYAAVFDTAAQPILAVKTDIGFCSVAIDNALTGFGSGGGLLVMLGAEMPYGTTEYRIQATTNQTANCPVMFMYEDSLVL